jgi:hypothetical protein
MEVSEKLTVCPPLTPRKEPLYALDQRLRGTRVVMDYNSITLTTTTTTTIGRWLSSQRSALLPL